MTLPGRRKRRLLVLGPVRVDFFLQIVILLAYTGADSFQRGQLLFRLGGIPGHQVGFAEVFVRAAVARIDLQRALIVLERWLELAGVAVGESEQVLDVGAAGIALERVAKSGPRLAGGGGTAPPDQGSSRGAAPRGDPGRGGGAPPAKNPGPGSSGAGRSGKSV